MFTSLVFAPPRDVGMGGDLVSTQYSPIPSNTLPRKYSTMVESFNLAKNTLVLRGYVGIFRDYPLQTRLSKQPIGDFSRYGIIPFDPLKYTRSKQVLSFFCLHLVWCQILLRLYSVCPPVHSWRYMTKIWAANLICKIWLVSMHSFWAQSKQNCFIVAFICFLCFCLLIYLLSLFLPAHCLLISLWHYVQD
jgi:hypothetical protein